MFLVASQMQAADPPQPMPDTPLDVKAVRAFPELKFRRPVLLTNAGDGSNRIFVCSQQGKIFVFPDKPDVEAADTFLDWEKKTIYKDEEFEEGILGLAFHPKFKSNGEFFMYYTEVPHISVISRFKVSKDDQFVLRFRRHKPIWCRHFLGPSGQHQDSANDDQHGGFGFDRQQPLLSQQRHQTAH